MPQISAHSLQSLVNNIVDSMVFDCIPDGDLHPAPRHYHNNTPLEYISHSRTKLGQPHPQPYPSLLHHPLFQHIVGHYAHETDLYNIS
jgi:hypothetical protein